MTVRHRFVSFACFTILLLTSLGSFAQNKVITINGGKNAIFVGPQSHSITPALTPTAGLVPIYTNLGQGSNVYDAIAGSGILGKDAGQPRPQWAACGFTPTADHTVLEIKVGVSHVMGSDPFLLSLNEDAGGIPGKVLHAWQFSGLPEFGTCCTVQTGRVKPGIAVKGGQMYWVVTRTLASNPDTYDVWNNDFNGENGPFANNLGHGWINEGIQQMGALGVFGQ